MEQMQMDDFRKSQKSLEWKQWEFIAVWPKWSKSAHEEEIKLNNQGTEVFSKPLLPHLSSEDKYYACLYFIKFIVNTNSIMKVKNLISCKVHIRQL